MGQDGPRGGDHVRHELADHRRPLRLALLVGLLLGATFAADGQNLDSVPRHFFNQKRFEIPFKMKAGRKVSSVRLHASTDGKTFNLVATASPADRQFDFTAEAEGWHYFVVQVEDDKKNLIPPTVDASVVDLQVCVDTVPPVIEKFEAVIPNPKEGTVGVEWSVKDEQQLNLKLLQLEYRLAKAKNGEWAKVPIKPMTPAQVGWFPPDPGEYVVRLTAFDMAGNTASKEVKVTAKTGGPGDQQSPTPQNPDGPEVQHVPARKFKLHYRIDNVGESGIKNVEIWKTSDTHSWVKFRDNAPPDPKDGYELQVTAPGRYGFTVRPISNTLKAAPPPNPNDQPQIWIEVDETKPVVQIVGVTAGEGKHEGTVTVRWRATDKWLKSDPITILASKTKEGDWKELASNLPNTGSFELTADKLKLIDHYAFYLRVEARDKAGNVGFDETKDTVKVDTKTPKAIEVKVFGVSP